MELFIAIWDSWYLLASQFSWCHREAAMILPARLDSGEGETLYMLGGDFCEATTMLVELIWE